MRVFLIHGMGRTKVSMALLGRRLSKAGHDVASFGYFVLRDPLDVIAQKLVAFIEERRADAPYAVIGHSLGNIVTRIALPALTGLEALIMLAPSNQSPIAARTLRGNPLFHALARDAGKKLLDEKFYAALPIPRVHTLVIAGTSGPKLAWLPFRGAPSDGIVRVEETRLPGVPHVEVPALHTFIMNDAAVCKLALKFLEERARPAA